MMLLDIHSIGDDGLAFDESLCLARVAREAPDFVEAPTLTVRGTVRPGPSTRDPAEGAIVEGTIEGTLRLRCSRCLEDVEVPCRAAFRFVLVAEAPVSDDQDQDEEAASTQFFEIEGGKLALDDLAAEQVYLEMPQKPLCDESCAGLCPTCGINRNRLECACRVEDVDPRLAALQEIRDRMRES